MRNMFVEAQLFHFPAGSAIFRTWRGRGFLASIAALAVAAVEVPYRWQARAEQRLRLGEMEGRMLRDIGINRLEAEREARKPFWQD